MVLIHILGGTLVGVGLLLFILDQIRGKPDEDAKMSAWKINLSGPPALVLTVIGAIIFIFPFTSFFSNPEDPNPPTEIITTTVVAVPGETTPTTLIPEVGLPLSPTNSQVILDEQCGFDTLVWDQEGIVDGWWISIEAHNPDDDSVWETYEIDTGFDSLTLGNVSGLCYFDFVSPDFLLYYYLWVYAYNDAGFSEEPLFIEFVDF